MLLAGCVLTTPFGVIFSINESAPAAHKVLNGLPVIGYPDIAGRFRRNIALSVETRPHASVKQFSVLPNLYSVP